MKTYYTAQGWGKFSEVGNYKKGCDPATTNHFGGNDMFTAPTVDELIGKLMAFCDTKDKQNVLINSCDEIGRVDIQVMETDEGYSAGTREIERWKEGIETLWLACYSFHIEKIQAEPVDLSTLTDKEYSRS